ncbi:MAG: hypothetical protein BGP24_23815 [Lysobacterales bacterium 69-70]|nr:hypothetical protein [Xanthomonadaceae bacterium]ODU34405.1 MAG: hypothetical protein ABS97_09995 [Xanthomonadaceae bacterium SCN 69-320]ODV22514.1 MAG: hypothetical protein ABT27_02155 [Xanthomonadaceae bacterium SCN 69-25]OJY96310.1 MAG: hypothetical protein BGP24_23815 [Xanthomonadales bacterium 69-70]
MNIKRERAPIKKSRLENEVILAVVILYVLLSAAMLLIHHLQPDDVATKTSSTAPAHDYFSDDADGRNAAAAGPDAAQIQALLARAGYSDVRELHREGARYRAVASKDGRTWQVDLELPPPLLTATPLTP